MIFAGNYTQLIYNQSIFASEKIRSYFTNRFNDPGHQLFFRRHCNAINIYCFAHNLQHKQMTVKKNNAPLTAQISREFKTVPPSHAPHCALYVEDSEKSGGQLGYDPVWLPHGAGELLGDSGNYERRS